MTIEITPVTAVIGAEVRGVDMREPLTDVDVKVIQQALLDHLVLFFRDQHITDEQQVAFALNFGPMYVSPFETVYQESPDIVVLDQVAPKGEGADVWHSDLTFLADPPLGSILRAVQMPAVGGDTCFASAYAAYDALTPAMRELVDGLTAVHDITKTLTQAIRDGHSTMDLAETQKKFPPVEHKVAVTHPDTGRKALYVNRNSTTHIKGLSERENEVLLPFLQDHIRSPGVPVPPALGGGHGGVLGQPLGGALRGRRLPGAPRHAPLHRRRRERAVATDTWTTRPSTSRSPARSGSSPGCTRVGLLVDAFQHRCLDEFGLLFIDHSVLRVLELIGEPYQMSPSELADILLRSSGGMTQILDRLERAGLVARTPDPDDRRKVMVALTPKGLATADAANLVYKRERERLLADLSDDEIEQLDAALGRLLDVLNEDARVRS